MSLKNNPISKSLKIRVGITLGDPSGIGPAVISKAINLIAKLADITVIGDAWVFNKAGGVNRKADSSRLKASFKFVDLNNISRKEFEFGIIDPKYGRASVEYLDKAIQLIKENELDCIVTCPISKEAINLAGFRFLGHTEYLAKQFSIEDFAMMLLNSRLKFTLITRHIPLKDVPCSLSVDEICKNTTLTIESLKKLFLIKKPRIVVCGLNPHASDNGLIGQEENAVIKPAINILRKRTDAYVSGPLPADVAIHGAYKKEFDACIVMFHDQALIPLKLIENLEGVNITLGLPFVRTSPLHGTAFDIAKKTDLINPSSLIEAVTLAVKCTLNQRKD